MSIAITGKAFYSGSVFYFDLFNEKSYRGEPTTNYLTTALSINSATKESFSGTVTENSVIAPDGTMTATEISCSAGYVYQTLTIPTGSTITYSVWMKSLDSISKTGPWIWNYQNPTYGIVAQDTSGLTSEWKRFRMTYTTLAHQSSFAIAYAGVNYGLSGKLAIWQPQLEYKAYPTPFVFGTRSISGSLFDLTKKSPVDLTGAGYTSSSLISLNGSNQSFTIGNHSLGNTFTVSAWVRPAAVSGDYAIVGTNANGCDNWFGINTNKLYGMVTEIADVNNFTFSGTRDLVAGRWIHATMTVNVNVVKMYVNGVLDYTGNTAFTIGSWNGDFAVGLRCPGLGQRYLNGEVGSVMLNRVVMNDTEIMREFNRTKRRYGF